MESQGNNQLKVGIFLTVGIVIILASIFALQGDKSFFTSSVRIHAYFDQVQGLSTGSVVSLSGVTVGNVESIQFVNEKNSLDVTLKINQEHIGRIRKGSEVEIRTQGALGDKYVFIVPGELSNPVVNDGDILKTVTAKDLLGIMSERGSEAGKIFDLINELHKTAVTINADNKLHRILNNLESASNGFNQTSKESQKLLLQINGQGAGEKLAKSLDRLDGILSKIDRGEGTLGALINDPAIHNQLKSLLGASSNKSTVKSLLRNSIEKQGKD